MNPYDPVQEPELHEGYERATGAQLPTFEQRLAGVKADLAREHFWTARESLAFIHATARERLVSPWATLGGVLAHVCTRVGPQVVLPAIVGGVASLNTFWAMVGPSGGGKDAALAVARELLDLDDDIPTHEVGTGQGIDSTYTAQTKGGPVQFCDSALFTVTEIDTLAGHAKMSGSTVMATLRKVYSGSALGARYADKEKRRPVREHRYRAAVVAGVQPGRSRVLLGDADGGTPQRWLWLPTNDPEAALDTRDDRSPRVSRGPLWSQYEYLSAYGESHDDGAVPQRPRVEIKVCDAAREAIVENRRGRLATSLLGDEDDLNGHALLTRLKVAALLAIFERGRAEVDEDDWDLGGVVMAVSDETRAVCQSALNDQQRRANVARAYQEADREEIVVDRSEQRVAAALGRALRRNGDWMLRKDLRGTLRSTDRALFEPAMQRLVSAGQVEATAIEADKLGRSVDGCRYRATPGGTE